MREHHPGPNRNKPGAGRPETGRTYRINSLRVLAIRRRANGDCRETRGFGRTH